MQFQPIKHVFVFSIAFAVAYSTSAFAPTRAAAGEPFAYRSEAGRFSIDLPAEPPSVRELSGSRFSITDNNVLHTVFAEGAEFSIEIHDIPRIAKLLLSSRYILDRSVAGMLEDIGAREVDSAEASFQGKPAREVVFEIPERAFTGRSLLVLAERRLYLVSVQHPRSIPPPGSIAPFFESFSFWLE